MMDEQVQETKQAPKDPTLVVCPSGLTGHIRKLKTDELELLADRRRLRDGTAYDKILERCWVETTNLGPYKAPLNWDDVLQGDRFFVLLALRHLVYGVYKFDVQCPTCENTIPWQLDLTQLPQQPYSSESLRKHQAGERFETEVAGKKVSFRLITGKHEKKLAQILQGKSPIAASVAYRLLSVEGLEEKSDFRPWVSNLDADLLIELRDKMDEQSGGVNTTIAVECETVICGRRTEIELPFGGPDFWAPKKRGSSKASQKNTGT